jgi:hypothetical protein
MPKTALVGREANFFDIFFCVVKRSNKHVQNLQFKFPCFPFKNIANLVFQKQLFLINNGEKLVYKNSSGSEGRKQFLKWCCVFLWQKDQIQIFN